MDKINKNNKEKKKRGGLYIRVSTLDQTTLNQEIELRRYCKYNNIEIYKIYKEEGVSGSKTSRPQLDIMLEDMRLKRFDAIIVWNFDRLGRNTKHMLQILEEMNSKGVKLIATNQNIDTSTSMGKLFFTILSAFAEKERESIRERVLLGLERRRSEGKPMGRPKGSKDKRSRKYGGYLGNTNSSKRLIGRRGQNK